MAKLLKVTEKEKARKKDGETEEKIKYREKY